MREGVVKYRGPTPSLPHSFPAPLSRWPLIMVVAWSVVVVMVYMVVAAAGQGTGVVSFWTMFVVYFVFI